MLDYLSVSRLKTYACPFRFRELCLRGVVEPGGEMAQIGSYTHRLIAEYIAADHGLVAPTTYPYDLPLVPVPDLAQEAENLAAQWLDHEILAGMKPLAVECELRGTLDNLTPFIGHLDCVCDWKGSLVLWDWKTGWNMPQTLGNEAQLATYAWLAAGQWPELAEGPIYIRQRYLRYGRTLEAQITEAGRTNARYTLTRLAEGIEATLERTDAEWPACPCTQCGFCSLACPLSDVVVRAPQSAQDARTLAGRLFALESQTTAANGALRAWCDEHGPVRACGREYGYTPTKSRTVAQRPQELIELLGEDAWTWLKVAPPKGKVPEGVTVEESVSGSRFGGRKAKGTEDETTQ